MQFLRKYWLPIAVALILIVVGATQCAPYMIEDIQRHQDLAHADALMEEGEYEEAYEALMVWFRRGANLHEDYARYYLCNAHIAYERGDVDSAEIHLGLYANYCPEYRWSGETRAFADTVTQEAEALAAQQRAEVAARKAAERAAYEERVRSGPPFVGMYIRYINDTALGEGRISDIERRYVDGELTTIKIYDYYDEDGEVIYSARTVGGEVTEVWPGGYDPPITFSSPRRDYEEEEEEDRFNASSYANEEDFYYDNYYDFFDYEDAADYYRKHTE